MFTLFLSTAFDNFLLACQPSKAISLYIGTSLEWFGSVPGLIRALCIVDAHLATPS